MVNCCIIPIAVGWISEKYDSSPVVTAPAMMKKKSVINPTIWFLLKKSCISLAARTLTPPSQHRQQRYILYPILSISFHPRERKLISPMYNCKSVLVISWHCVVSLWQLIKRVRSSLKSKQSLEKGDCIGFLIRVKPHDAQSHKIICKIALHCFGLQIFGLNL